MCCISPSRRRSQRAFAKTTLEGTDNFFLDGDWQETRTAAEGNQGYVAAVEPVCAEDEILNGARDGCIPDPNAGGDDASAPARKESKVRDNAWTAFGGALAVGVLSYLLSDGTLLGYSATPDFGYSLTESGYAVNAGGRVDFRKDRWHLYWTAGQQSVNGDFGDFRYSSGGKWQGDIFAAAFSEKVQGKTADYDLSLSANYDNGIWKVSPEFAAHSVYEKGEFATTNSFRINGEMRYDDWRFSVKRQFGRECIFPPSTDSNRRRFRLPPEWNGERKTGGRNVALFFSNKPIPAKAGISAPQGALFRKICTRKRSRFAR